MARDFRVTGADDLARAAKALKAYGDVGKAGRKELLKSIQTSTKPVKNALKASALESLPKSGGLSAVVASSSFRTKTKTGSRSAGVKITAVGKTGKLTDIRSIERGRLRHPVFAQGDDRRKWTWVNQAITPGFFTTPLEAIAHTVRRDLIGAMDRIVNDVARRSRG